MTKSQAATLRRKIRRLATAKVQDSWKGGGDPDWVPDIERELKMAADDLNHYIDRLTEPTT